MEIATKSQLHQSTQYLNVSIRVIFTGDTSGKRWIVWRGRHDRTIPKGVGDGFAGSLRESLGAKRCDVDEGRAAVDQIGDDLAGRRRGSQADMTVAKREARIGRMRRAADDRHRVGQRRPMPHPALAFVPRRPGRSRCALTSSASARR